MPTTEEEVSEEEECCCDCHRRFYCLVCNLRSEGPHDHTDDTVEPLIPPWRYNF